MPEGDTIFRTARRLDRALAGLEVTGFDAATASLSSLPVPGAVVGRVLERVESRGKHLLMTFSGALVLHTHMRMHGEWHLYRPGERWRARRADLRVHIETAAWHAIGFRIPVAEWLTPGLVARHPILSSLGPDLLAEVAEPSESRRRLRACGTRSIADALLDQRVISGIGNVYRSEVLFAERIYPFAPVTALSDEALDRLVAAARRLLALNVREPAVPSSGRRTTGRLDPRESLWVYGRAGQACHRCRGVIERRRTGDDARTVYWCARCQDRFAEAGPATS